jgi:hypothetical protein
LKNSFAKVGAFSSE